MIQMSRLTPSSDYMPGIMEDVEISKLKQPAHPIRSSLDEIEDLINSIRKSGLLQPIVVRVIGSEGYEIVAGNRRCKACKSLGWRKIPCIIVDLNDQEAFEVSLVENVQRKSLDVMDEARAFKNYVVNFGWGGMSDLSRKLGKSVSYVTKRIQLLDLPSDVIDMVDKSTLTPSIAEELSSIKNKTKQSDLAVLISKRGLSLRKARLLVQSENGFIAPELLYEKDTNQIRVQKVTRSIDKAIVALRIAMSRVGTIIENSDNDIVFQILMNQKKNLHEQIDILMKEKKKIITNSRKFFGAEKFYSLQS